MGDIGLGVERADGGVGATDARHGWQERQAQRSGDERSEEGSEASARRGRHGTTVVVENPFYRSRVFGVFSLTASRISALNTASSTVSVSWKSMARTVLLSRRVLKSFFGSFI